MATEIIIVDEEITDEIGQLKKMCTKMESMLTYLATHMQTAQGAMEGNVAKNFQTLVDQINDLKGQFDYVSTECDSITTTFMKEIEEADKWLYEN